MAKKGKLLDPGNPERGSGKARCKTQAERPAGRGLGDNTDVGCWGASPA